MNSQPVAMHFEYHDELSSFRADSGTRKAFDLGMILRARLPQIRLSMLNAPSSAPGGGTESWLLWQLRCSPRRELFAIRDTN